MNRTPPRGTSGQTLGGLSEIFFTRRYLQFLLFFFLAACLFMMRRQWIASMPQSIDPALLSRQNIDARILPKESLASLQTQYERSQRDEASLRIHNALRKESRRNPDHTPEQILVRPNGELQQTYSPNTDDMIEAIYARGKKRLKDELHRRGGNYSLIQPFNVWTEIYIWDWFSPDYNCPTMERVGRVGDGGKWVCGVDLLPHRKCLMYSYGVNNDLSFELEMVERTGCEVHAFDPTVGGVPADCKDNPHINFHKQALGPSSGPSNIFLLVENILDTMKREDHTFIDILKVDVEGSEWETFSALASEKALPFGQLLIELHFRDTVEVFDFFDNMDTHGYRIFMRETNHNPCVAGKLPIAVEFSLINPQLYFTGQPQLESMQSIAARPEPKVYDGVIYVLSHKGNIKRLMGMLLKLEKNFNKRYGYPVIVYHTDFSLEHEEHLQSTVNMELTFRQVNFTIPAWLDQAKIPERTPCSSHSSTVGYRHMNRFLAYFAAEELSKEFEWQWRLDDDSQINDEIGYDVFDLMAQNQKRYGFTNIVQDDAKCVLGLWDAARQYLDRLDLQPTFFTRWREGAVFYNNFEVSHRSIWQSPEYREYFDYIDHLGGIYYHRWGDAPIRTIGVSLFVNENEVHHFTDIAYTHQPFIARNATGLPSPKQSLFSRETNFQYNFLTNCSEPVPGVSINDSCSLGKPSGIIYLSLNDHPDTLRELNGTLQSLDRFFNNHFQYPVAIFGHDLTYEVRQSLRHSTRSVLEFHDLSFLRYRELPDYIESFGIPTSIDCGFGDDSIDDRMQNRYMAYEGISQLADKYDWILRLAPGAQITENVTVNPFSRMQHLGKRFGYLMTVSDDKRCISTFPTAVKAFIQTNISESFWQQTHTLAPTFHHVLPEDSIFYDGFQISHHSLWQSPEYKTFFEYIDRKGGMLYERWTETNLVTAALSLYTPADYLHRFSDIGIRHAPFVNQSTNRNVIKRKVADIWEGYYIHVESQTGLDPLFAPRQVGFLGSDVATSFRLPPSAGYGDYCWLFGDTYVGTHDGFRRQSPAYIISNTVAVLPSAAKPTASDATFYWRQQPDGSFGPVFTSESDSNIILWPVHGLSVEYNRTSKIILLAQRVLKLHDLTEFLIGEGVNFDVLGTSVIIIDNPAAVPTRWQYRVLDMPGTDSMHNWYSAVAIMNGKEVATSPEDVVYLVGNQGTVGIGAFSHESKNILGRITVADLLHGQFEQLESLTTETREGKAVWAHRVPPKSQQAIFTPANSETSLQYNRELEIWTALEVDTVTAQLVLWTAPRVEGPWRSTVIHSIEAPYDDLTKYRCYAGKGHPELAGVSPGQGTELVYSYVCNSPSDARWLFEEHQLRLYTPRFIRVRLEQRADSPSKT